MIPFSNLVKMYVIFISSGILIVLTSTIVLLFILVCDHLDNSHVFFPLCFFFAPAAIGVGTQQG